MSDLNKTWSSNHGWLLSGASLMVGLAACIILYMDWVPRISFVNATGKPPVISQSIQPQSGILVAQIISPDGSRGKKGKILLYSRNNTEQTQPPLHQEKFVLDERGTSTILLIVPTAEYTVLAFMDDNDNGQLDFVDAKAVEKFRLPQNVVSARDTEQSIAVEDGLVSIQSQVPIMCIFDFSLPEK
jgi:hypothetical protein